MGLVERDVDAAPLVGGDLFDSFVVFPRGDLF